MIIVGVDVGGTFTDLILADTARASTVVHKVASTPDDPSRGVLQGLVELCEKAGVETASVTHVLHATTVATNAMLEHKGARTGMVTTEGYRDILHIGRHQRPQNYSIQQEIPWQERPLVKRRHRLTVRERLVPPRGEVLEPLDEEGVRAAAQALREAGASRRSRSVSCSATSTRRMRSGPQAILRGGAAGDVRHHLLGGVAAVPRVRALHHRRHERLHRAQGARAMSAALEGGAGRGRLRAPICTSWAPTAASPRPPWWPRSPVLTLLSGPAAGVLGGAWSRCPLAGATTLITFDVGGTSADIGIVTGGGFAEATARDTWIAGFPVLVPMIDVHTIGAGGGSIAWIDAGGRLPGRARERRRQAGPGRLRPRRHRARP